MDSNAFWSWSMLLWRTRSLELRVSWTMFAWMLIDAVQFARSGSWLMIPFAVLVPGLSMYLHAMAHVGMARLVGGSADLTVLAIINDRTQMTVPLNPAKQFAAAAAGPMISLVLWLASALAAFVFMPSAGREPSGLASSAGFLFPGSAHAAALGWQIVGYVATVNFWIFALNLLACSVFDGARMWRAMFWPLVGLTRAVRWTVMLSYGCSLLMVGLGVWAPDWMLLLFGIFCLLATVSEHRSVRLGFDPVLQIEYESLSQNRRSRSWLSRWNARRRQRAELRREREEAAEQELLDRLLTKVSEHGLHSLTDQERTTLQKISRKQRERQEAGMG